MGYLGPGAEFSFKIRGLQTNHKEPSMYSRAALGRCRSSRAHRRCITNSAVVLSEELQTTSLRVTGGQTPTRHLETSVTAGYVCLSVGRTDGRTDAHRATGAGSYYTTASRRVSFSRKLSTEADKARTLQCTQSTGVGHDMPAIRVLKMP